MCNGSIKPGSLIGHNRAKMKMKKIAKIILAMLGIVIGCGQSDKKKCKKN